MIVKNPTKEEISIQVLGTTYTVGAGEEISVPESVAKYWQESIHNFIIVSPEKAVVVPKVELKKVDPEVVEEKKEEAPVVASVPTPTKAKAK